MQSTEMSASRRSSVFTSTTGADETLASPSAAAPTMIHACRPKSRVVDRPPPSLDHDTDESKAEAVVELASIMTMAGTSASSNPVSPGPSSPPLPDLARPQDFVPPARPSSTPFPQPEPRNDEIICASCPSDDWPWDNRGPWDESGMPPFDDATHAEQRPGINLNDLPPEIHECILDHLFGYRVSAASKSSMGMNCVTRSWGTALRHSRRRELSELALVSHVWRVLIQERLYRHIKLKATISSISEAVQFFMAHPDLRPYVKHIEIWFPVFQPKIGWPTPSVPSLTSLDGLGAGIFVLPPDNCSLEEAFYFVSTTFPGVTVLTLEGGERKKAPRVRHFINDAELSRKRARALPSSSPTTPPAAETSEETAPAQPSDSSSASVPSTETSDTTPSEPSSSASSSPPPTEISDSSTLLPSGSQPETEPASLFSAASPQSPLSAEAPTEAPVETPADTAPVPSVLLPQRQSQPVPQPQEFEPIIRREMPKVASVRTLVCKGQWNLIRSEEDFLDIVSALPSLEEWHGSYNKPKSKSYLTMARIVPRLPRSLTKLHLCLEADYRRELGCPPFFHKVAKQVHFCHRLGAATAGLEHISYTGRVCQGFFNTLIAASDPRGRSRVKSVELTVKNCCRQVQHWNESGSGIMDLHFIYAFEALVIAGIRALKRLPNLEYLRIRYVDLESPIPALNPFFVLGRDHVCYGVWSDNILRALHAARPTAHFRELSENPGLISWHKDGRVLITPEATGKVTSIKLDNYRFIAGNAHIPI